MISSLGTNINPAHWLYEQSFPCSRLHPPSASPQSFTGGSKAAQQPATHSPADFVVQSSFPVRSQTLALCTS